MFMKSKTLVGATPGYSCDIYTPPQMKHLCKTT